jgi:glycosyltransferase involved in cell wall biosynthesis
MQKKILFVYINKFKEYPIIYEYCTNLQKRGFDVSYLGIGAGEEKYADESGVTVYHTKAASNTSTLRRAFLLAKSVKTKKPDLVHVFHFRGAFLLPLATLFFTKFLLDVRTVHVANNKGRHSMLTPLKNLLTWFESQFYPNTIALTAEIRQMLKPAYKHIEIIPLGANLQRFRMPENIGAGNLIRKELGWTDKKVFLYSGTLSPARRIDLLIEAFALLCNNTDAARLIVAGGDKDDPSTLESLEALTARLKLQDKVVFTGFLQYNKLLPYYKAADIGLCYIPQTSYYDNQPPTKLFEYMAADLVVIATNTSANKEIISNGINGFLSNDSSEELSISMHSVAFNNWNNRAGIIKAAGDSVQKYSWDYIIENHLCKYYAGVFK